MQIIKTCDECESEYKAESSAMENLCPECSHLLYGYENCPHEFENGKCIYCYWDESQSSFTKEVKKMNDTISTGADYTCA